MKRFARVRLGLAGLAAGLLVVPGSVGAQVVDLRQPAGREWATVGGSWSNARFSSLDQITSTNVKDLRGAWMQRLGSGIGSKYSQQGTPLVKDGVMFIPTGQQDIFALDAVTGDILWSFISEDVDERSDGTWASRGVALGEGLVFNGRIDGSLVAVDQKTGRRVWRAQVGDKPPFVEPLFPGWRQQTQFINSAPLYHDGIVYTGLSGGDRGLRGRVTALDARTGQELWRFYTIPGPGEFGHDTWPQNSPAWESGGGAIWSTPAVDPDLGLLYFNTGNAWPDFDGSGRPGDNLFTASIVAIDARTGQYRWHQQLVHHDIWDHDVPVPVVLFEQVFDGVMRKGIASMNPAGYLFMFDRATGEPLIPIEERPVPQEPRHFTSATQPYPVRGEPVIPQCVTAPPPGYTGACVYEPFWSLPDGKAQPGSGVRQAPMSFSPQTGYFYVVGAFSMGGFKRVDDFNGAMLPIIGSRRSGHLTAIDSRTNTIAWQKQFPYPLLNGSGTMTTAGGLVFIGSPDGNAIAYDARTGEELWRFQTGWGADAGPATYEINGDQYVAYATGGGRGSPGNGDGIWSFKLRGRLNPLHPPPAPTVSIGFSGTPVQANAVTIRAFEFQPQRVTVPVGTTVTWTNSDGEPHTATEQTGRWDTGLLREGESGSITLSTAGTYTYYCAPHPWMVGQIIVQ
jgi:quinohemoprotein ethanol dehydrogenase